MEVKIEKLDNFGRGITYINEKICFIENTFPEEIVEIKIIKETKKYLEAEVISYKRKSPKRIIEACPYSKECGGCHLNHISYEEENLFKMEKVKAISKKFVNIHPNIIEPIIYHERDNYRNKITLHGKDGILGLYKKKSNDIIPITKCILVNPKINEIITIINKININIKEVIIKTSNDNSQVMVSITGKIKDYSTLLEKCTIVILNGKYISKNKYIKTTIGNKIYQESINSFFQINNTLTKSLYDEIKSQIKNKNYQTILDLYCGAGTIGIYISDECQKIIGIDYNSSNIKDAQENKKLNQVNNIDFICDKVENQINTFKNIDLIIVDPPRTGLDSKTRKYLKLINPKRIIYVSCDPITLARDLKELINHYDIKYIKPFNMFPRTYHCETIAVLERR